MSLFLQLAFLLAIILFAAKAAGYISVRIGQPSVLGELMAGILLGPSLLNLLGFSFIAHELPEVIRLFRRTRRIVAYVPCRAGIPTG
jgi:Kef-type K+ transport system membrane component KefB